MNIHTTVNAYLMVLLWLFLSIDIPYLTTSLVIIDASLRVICAYTLIMILVNVKITVSDGMMFQRHYGHEITYQLLILGTLSAYAFYNYQAMVWLVSFEYILFMVTSLVNNDRVAKNGKRQIKF